MPQAQASIAFPVKTVYPGRYLLESSIRLLRTKRRVRQQYHGGLRDTTKGYLVFWKSYHLQRGDSVSYFIKYEVLRIPCVSRLFFLLAGFRRPIVTQFLTFFLSGLSNRQSVPWAMSFSGLDLM